MDYKYEQYPEENEEGKRSPADKNMPYEDIIVTTEDEVKLAGWFIRDPAKSKIHPTIIYMQENYGNIGYRLSWAENLYHNLAVNIVIVGYRGYGHSEGTPSEQGIEKDSKAIIAWTLNNDEIDQNQVYVFGNVLGGAVAVYGGSFYQDKLKGLILQNTFLNMANAIDDTNWLFRLLRPLVLANYWPTDERIVNTTLPILFISGTNTKTNDDMHDLFDKAVDSSYKKFLEVQGADKSNTWRVGGQSYIKAIFDFISYTKTLIYIPIETDGDIDISISSA